MRKPLDTYLTVRLLKQDRDNFYTKCEKYGKTSDILRELINAFVEDRLVIHQSKLKESLYVTRNED